MDATDREKLKRFISDPRMSEAVKAVLLQAFLKPRKEADVQTLAASRIAIDLLQEAWKELEKYKKDEKETPDRVGNPGV